MTRPSSVPHSIHERALADIRYIRSTVESAGEFTAVPGLGGVQTANLLLGLGFGVVQIATGVVIMRRYGG